MAGTFAWAAPELLLGARCTEKVDVRCVLQQQLGCFDSLRAALPQLCHVLDAPSHPAAQGLLLCCISVTSATGASQRLRLPVFALPQIFSFGVVLWEIVTGERPLRGQTRELRCASAAFCLD